MATFFDSKQEVIDFQLTPHGKRLLSKGKFKPAFYSFVDEGVIYDSNYFSASTNQNDIESRIQDQTPVLKVSPLTYGIERDLKSKGNVSEKLLVDKLSVLSNSQIGSEYAPSWNVSLLKNTIINTQPYYTSSDGFYITIPQINISCSYIEQIRLDSLYIQAKQLFTEESYEGDTTSFETSPLGLLSSENISPTSLEIQSKIEGKKSTFLTSKHFEDGTIFTIEEDEIVIDLTQFNVGLDEEYEIEVFKFEKDKNNKEIIVPLDFMFKENENIIDDLLIDVSENFTTLQLDDLKVEYFINLNVDKEIEQRIVCDYIVPLTKGKGVNNNLICKNSENKIKTGKLYNNNGSDFGILPDGQIQNNSVGAIDPVSISNKVIC
ncbi:MAG: hypothetical protein RIR47_130 [Bacteroidota bacterium]|jgi:hypothetical protein